LVIKSEDKSDLVSKNKTIYDASAGEIFWRNFLAGASRGLGGIFVNLIFLLIIGVLFINIILPQVMPMVNSYLNIFKLPGKINNLPQNFGLPQLLGQ